MLKNWIKLYVCVCVLVYCIYNGEVIILPEGPNLVLDLDERGSKMMWEANPLNEDWRLTKNGAWYRVDWENMLKWL